MVLSSTSWPIWVVWPQDGRKTTRLDLTDTKHDHIVQKIAAPHTDTDDVTIPHMQKADCFVCISTSSDIDHPKLGDFGGRRPRKLR